MIKEKREFKVLVIEDNPGDFALVEEFLLEQIEILSIVHAKNFNEAKGILLKDDDLFDIVLLDISLPDKASTSLIKEIIELCPNTPVIVLTGYADFSFGVQSLSLGISDYILKEELTSISLYKSIVYSSERKKAILALVESEKKYSELFHLSPQPMWVFDIISHNFLNVNNAAIKHYGYGQEEFLSMTIDDITLAEETSELEEKITGSGHHYGLAFNGTHIHKKKNAELIKVQTQGNIIDYKGQKAVVVLAIDITERSNYIKAIEEQNEKLREIAWIQSHIVRAPLSRILGLVQIFKDLKEDCKEKEQMLEYLLLSANELDRVIMNITDISEITAMQPS